MACPGLPKEDFGCDERGLISRGIIQFGFQKVGGIVEFVFQILPVGQTEIGFIRAGHPAPDEIASTVTPEEVVPIVPDDQVVFGAAEKQVIAGTSVDVILSAGTRIRGTGACEDEAPLDPRGHAVITQDDIRGNVE